MSTKTPDYLVVGHLTKDLTPNDPKGYTFGGTAAYSAITAHRLGKRAAIVTSAEESFVQEFWSAFPDIDVYKQESSI